LPVVKVIKDVEARDSWIWQIHALERPERLA
jgi:hypothetical protein